MSVKTNSPSAKDIGDALVASLGAARILGGAAAGGGGGAGGGVHPTGPMPSLYMFNMTGLPVNVL